MQMLATSLDTYRLDLGDYPPNLAELRQSTRTGWDGPYLPRDIPLDPWGHPYQFQVPGENGQPYMLRSFAKDGSPGGEGDGADIVFQ
jgi:general secretion pathway protein G